MGTFKFIQYLILFIAYTQAFNVVRGDEQAHNPEPAKKKLSDQYWKEIQQAHLHVQNPEAPTGYERWRLAYTIPSEDISEQIGRLLYIEQSQSSVVDMYSRKTTQNSINLKNNATTSVGLELIELGLKNRCKDFLTPIEIKKCKEAATQLIKILDLKDAGNGFSGLPFYSRVKERFTQPEFQEQTLNFNSRIESIIQEFSKDPNFKLSENVYSVALKACNGNSRKAVEMLGILTSRDVLVTRYLKHLSSTNKEFIKAFGNLSLRIRLVADLDRKARNSFDDVFSFASNFSTKTEKNYYYWSSALVGQELKDLGYSDQIITKLATELPRQYKTYRYLEFIGPLKNEEWHKEFIRDAISTMNISAHGTIHGIQSAATTSLSENQRFESFVAALKEKKTTENLSKIRALRSMAITNKNTTPFIQLLYYDMAHSKIGLSHLKMVIDGKVYEIHRFKNSDGTYLRDRELIQGLTDSKVGTLPTGILELPATEEQKMKIIQFMQSEAASDMQYSYFNKLLKKDAYNCAGIMYDALKEGGYSLPALSQTKVLPSQIFNEITKKLPEGRVIGNSTETMSSILNSNFSKTTITGFNPSVNRDFGPLVGHELLQAEQGLSDTTPLLSNPRKVFGKVSKSFSNTGNLAEEFLPKNGNTMKLTTLIVPLEEFEKTKLSKNISELSKNILFINKDGKEQVRFFIHPNEVTQYQNWINQFPKDETQWIATPSSSARSLFVVDSEKKLKPFIIKTSLSEKMGGASRLITAEQTERAITINDLIENIHQDTKGKLPLSQKTWQFFKEPASVIPKNGGGMILREFKDATQNDIVLPWYSLISEKPASEKWINELYRYSGRDSMKEFIWNDLAKPVMEIHTELSLKNGITTELHQQNLMIVVDKDTKKVKGLMLRDMDGNWVDHSLRTNYLHKPSVGTGSLFEDAKTLNYLWAQENQFNSYAEIIRERSFGNIFKYALTTKDVQWIQKQSDEFYVHQFNKVFPKYKIENVTTLKEQWKQIHADVTTDAEKMIYEQIRNEKYKPISSFGKSLQNYRDVMVERKLSGSSTNPTSCLGVFLKQLLR